MTLPTAVIPKPGLPGLTTGPQRDPDTAGDVPAEVDLAAGIVKALAEYRLSRAPELPVTVPDSKRELPGGSGPLATGTGADPITDLDQDLMLARALVDARHGPLLELDRLAPGQMQALVKASPGILLALAAATATADPPIGSVTLAVSTLLAGDPAAMKALCEGINALPSLQNVSVLLPEKDPPASLDLSALRTENTPSVTVTGRSGLTVYVPKGTEVASSTLGPSLEKAWVQCMEGGQAHGAPRTLGNLVYYRQPKEFMSGDSKGATLASDIARRNLNSDIQFAGTRVESWRLETSDIVCRHLAASWLNDRAAYHARKAEALPAKPQAVPTGSPSLDSKPVQPARHRGKRTLEQTSEPRKRRATALPDDSKSSRPGTAHERFPLKAYAGYGTLPRHVPSSTEQDYRKAPGFAIFTPGAIGGMVRSLLQEMRSEGPAVRHFMLSDTGHVMAMELQVKTAKGRPPEHVVTFYDPNSTATHRRVVLDDKGLEAVAKEHLDFWTRMPSAREFGCHTLWAWPPRAPDSGPAASAKARIFGIDKGPFDPQFVFAALKVGDAGLVMKHLPACLHDKMTARDAELLAWGFGYAMERGSLEAACAYVQVVLDSALPQDALVELLHSAQIHPLYAALQGGEAEVAGEVTRRILDSRALSDAAKAGLVSHPRNGPRNTLPLLHVVSTREKLPFEAPGIEERQHFAVHAYATSIMKSPLPLDDKGQLLASDGAVARSLTRGNPCAAAAIVCAVLENSSGETAQDLLMAVCKGDTKPVGLADVLQALNQLKVQQDKDEGHSPCTAWISRLLQALPKAGVLSGDELHGLRIEHDSAYAEAASASVRPPDPALKGPG